MWNTNINIIRSLSLTIRLYQHITFLYVNYNSKLAFICIMAYTDNLKFQDVDFFFASQECK